MPGTSKVFAEYLDTISTVPAHHTFVAATKMGHRHSKPIDNITRKLQTRSGGSGIFYKMDRGEASSQHSSCGAENIFLAKHNMLFWSAQRDNNRQYQTIRLPHIQVFLPSNGGRSNLHISISPLV
jgi:hypothetical protein